MSGWIKFEKDLLTDPRVLRIAKTLSDRWKLYEEVGGNENFSAGNDAALPAVTLVCGALVRIWVLADTHVDPNNVLPLGKAELDEIIGVEGFCGILPECWMREIDEHSVELPDFHAHNGTEAKKKAVTQKRVARHRAIALHGGNGKALPDQDLDQTKTRPEKEEPKVAPLALPDWLDVDGWNAYVKTRKAPARKPESLKAALEKLEKFRSQGFDANEIVATSVANGWQGLFAPQASRGNGSEKTSGRPSITCSSCGQKAFTWTGGQCDPCWRKSQGLATRGIAA